MGSKDWPECSNHKCDQLYRLLMVEKEKAVMLLKAIERILAVIPHSLECKDMHHPSKWRHEYDEICPAVVEYGRAIHNALAAIKAAKG